MKIIEADQLLQTSQEETTQGPQGEEMSDVVIVQLHNDNFDAMM